ncbi:hypothetical protein MTO96_001204 [Rhipicephalus appendiculatus]
MRRRRHDSKDGQGSAAASRQENTSSSEAAARAAEELARRNHQLMAAAAGTAGLSESHKRRRDESDDLVDVDDDSRSAARAELRRPSWTSHSSKEPRHGLRQGGGNLSDASLSGSESSARTHAASANGHGDVSSAPKPRIWSIVDTATSGSPSHSMLSPDTPSAAAVAARMASLQRSARLDYLSSYHKTSSCVPIIMSPAAGLAPVSAGSSLTDSTTTASLSRLRTAAASSAAANMVLPKPAAALLRHRRDPRAPSISSGARSSAAAIAAAVASTSSSPTSAPQPSPL